MGVEGFGAVAGFVEMVWNAPAKELAPIFGRNPGCSLWEGLDGKLKRVVLESILPVHDTPLTNKCRASHLLTNGS